MGSALESNLRNLKDSLVACRHMTGTDKSLPCSVSDSFDQQINESHRHLVYVKSLSFPPLIQQLLLPFGDPAFIYWESSEGGHCSSVYSDTFPIQGNGQRSMLCSAARTNWKVQALHFHQGENVGAYGDNMFLLLK